MATALTTGVNVAIRLVAAAPRGPSPLRLLSGEGTKPSPAMPKGDDGPLPVQLVIGISGPTFIYWPVKRLPITPLSAHLFTIEIEDRPARSTVFDHGQIV